jgi:branched-chain amino acid aminotransferase
MSDNGIKALIDDDLVDLSHATIALSDLNYAYGIGVYETLRQRGGRRYFTEQHIERLFASAAEIGLVTALAPADIRRRLNVLREANPQADMNIRIMLLKSDSARSRCYMYPSDIPRVPGNADLEFPEPVGVDVIAYRGERHFPRAKSLSMLLSAVALDTARRAECWDALLVDRDDFLLEGSRSNLFWIRGDALFSPPEDRILAGVTRANILRCASEMGVELRIGELSLREQLSSPRPMILSSTSIAIQPISRIKTLEGPTAELPGNPLVRSLADYYARFLRERAETD